MVTEVLYVRVPVSLKTELETLATEHGVSLARVTARALEVYLVVHCKVPLAEKISQLP
jgi:hypothetical protein